MNLDAERVIAEAYGVKSVPTLLFFKGGRLGSQLSGTVSRSAIEAEVQKYL